MELLPIRHRQFAGDGLVLCAAVGRGTLEAALETLKPLWRALGRGRVVLVDDGTLSGANRTLLARQCGDPLILPSAVRGFPYGPEWALLAAALDGRHAEYWIVLDHELGFLVPATELASAVASNRSFARIGETSGPLEPHLAGFAADGWPYLAGVPGVSGYAAGGPDGTLALAILGRLEAVLGTETARRPEMARIVANFLLAREKAPVLMPLDAQDAR